MSWAFYVRLDYFTTFRPSQQANYILAPQIGIHPPWRELNLHGRLITAEKQAMFTLKLRDYTS